MSIAVPAAPDRTEYQASLFASAEPSIGALTGIERVHLDDESWVDVLPCWLDGADVVFEQLLDRLSWGQREVVMYERLLAEPRLTSWWTAESDAREPLPVLRDMRFALSAHYDRPFDTIGFNLYRDGRDSVAWHGDRERFRFEDPVVAIVSTGEPRAFQMRPRGGGASRTWHVGHGDLLVMGGRCQHQWEHAVPKVARPVGPRISVMFRHHLSGEDRRTLRETRG